MPEASPPTPDDPLRRAVSHVAHLLPAQGPITVFIHHNTLHAFEDRPFERAVVEGGELLGCEPFLSEDAYRAALASGRIDARAIEWVLDRELGDEAELEITDSIRARDALRALLVHGVPELRGRLLSWILDEREARVRLRPDVPSHARARILDDRDPRGVVDERAAVAALWTSCQALVERIPPVARPAEPAPPRIRDRMLAHLGVDVDDEVHPLLIRLCAAFLDQGIAYWPMPDRGRGFHACVTALYGQSRLPPLEPWARGLVSLLREDAEAGRDEEESVRHSLRELAVPEAEWERFLTHTALALRGWAGMMRQIEVRPDRVPVHAPPATLTGFLAVRLLLERAVISHLAKRELGTDDMRRLWSLPPREEDTSPRAQVTERAWVLFQLAQLLGLSAEDTSGLAVEAGARLLQLHRRFGGVGARRLLHLAYEKSFQDHVLGSLTRRREPPQVEARVQAILCIDEREESFRRHLEERLPSIETLGFAGFFAVPMYFRGLDDAHGRPLCPVNIKPEHEVVEVPRSALTTPAALRRAAHRGLSRGARGLAVGSTTLVRGTLITALAGVFSAVPLVLRVLFPRLTEALRKRGRALLTPRPPTELLLERSSRRPSLGRFSGFSVEEMADIVARVLSDVGISRRLAPLVLVIGHGSSSLNNPQESAHDCGACGGGHGGPNARAFARMANDERVRHLLRERGVDIPEPTWFVGGEHNTCHDGLELYDVHRAPKGVRDELAALAPALRDARAANAHERARRFASAPSGSSRRAALRHVEARSLDLAQPRPEYGHATAAACVIGPRALTRGLFLDRRAFLVSYDPDTDGDGAILSQIMSAATPVVAGIALEYYFGVVDPTGYGCGTKLPHNVTGLVGVMDGHASDLRPGLPWQMVEIHEPMRLLVVVCAPRARVERALAADAALARTATNQWVRLFVREPPSGELFELTSDGFRAAAVDAVALPRARSSHAFYARERGHLAIGEIVPARERA